MADEEKVEEVPIEWAIVLVKTKNKLELQNLPDQPQPSTIDDLYKELVVLIRNFDAEHSARVHTQKMMEAAMQVQGVQKSGLVTPPGVKT